MIGLRRNVLCREIVCREASLEFTEEMFEVSHQGLIYKTIVFINHISGQQNFHAVNGTLNFSPGGSCWQQSVNLKDIIC
jgi:hypothetical protein